MGLRGVAVAAGGVAALLALFVLLRPAGGRPPAGESGAEAPGSETAPTEARGGTGTDLHPAQAPPDRSELTPEASAPGGTGATPEDGGPPDAAPAEALPADRVALVVDVEGRGIEGAQVVLRGPDPEPLGTDFQGRVLLSHPPGAAAVRATHPDHGSSGWVHTSFGDPSAGEVVIELEPTVTVRGRVIDAEERPVPGARVKAWLGGTSVGGGTPATPGPVTADSEGRFAMSFDYRGRFYLRASADERRSQSCVVAPYAGGPEGEVVLRFLGRYGVSGTVVPSQGASVAGALVRIWGADDGPYADHGLGEPFGTTEELGEDGAFGIDVPHAGRYLVCVLPPHSGDVPQQRWVEIGELEPRARLEVFLVCGGEITGSVRHADGRPLAGVTVAVDARVPEDPGLPRAAQRPFDLYGGAVARTDADGAFRATGLRVDVEWQLSARPFPGERPDAVLRRDRVATGEHVELVVDEAALRGAFVEVVLRSAASGKPLESWEASLVHFLESGTRRTSWRRFEDSRGRMEWEGLVTGDRYGLLIRPEAAGDFATQRCVAGLGPFVAEAEGTRLDYDVPQPGELEVRVLAADGSPGFRAKVHVSWRGEVPAGSFYLPAPADEQGRVRFTDLRPGSYRMSAKRGEERARTAGVEIRSGVNPDLVLTLE